MILDASLKMDAIKQSMFILQLFIQFNELIPIIFKFHIPSAFNVDIPVAISLSFFKFQT